MADRQVTTGSTSRPVDGDDGNQGAYRHAWTPASAVSRLASFLGFSRGNRASYAPIPADEVPTSSGPLLSHETRVGVRRERTRRAINMTAVTLMLAMASYLTLAYAVRSSAPPCDTVDEGFQCDTATSHSWGQYSPYFSVPSDIDAAIPPQCDVTFVQVLSRHGARSPTASKSASYAKLIDHIQQTTTSYAPGYEFLKTYNYTLGADQLTPMGQQQMFNSGLKFYRRYRSLAHKAIPFVRASGQQRVVQSATNFTQGFHAAALADPEAAAPPRDDFPYAMVTIPETSSTNNTLNHGLCTAFETGPYSTLGDAAQAAYLSVFARPITSRLNIALPGANLSDLSTVALMDLCPFNAVALAPSSLSQKSFSLPPFCTLFTHADFLAYAYYQSLGKWYGYGPGNPLGPTQGVGFVNELLARLTGQAVQDGTSTNRTLDGSEETFPLGRRVYADFSHDNDIMGVLGALGVYGGVGEGGLRNDTRMEPGEVGGFAAGWAVPFGARVYVEKMRCGDGKQEEEELVRVLVNDRVMPLKGCGADARGMCTLSKFVESMAFARGNGKWDLCFS